MFGKNPYDRVDPFIENFESLKYNTSNIGSLSTYQKRQRQKGRKLKKIFFKSKISQENQPQRQKYIENEHCQESGLWHIPIAELQQNQEGQLILLPNKLFIEKINFFP